MRIRVLGAAAGGGFPQWNCGCPNCRGVRAGDIRATARTQESVAISADGERWFLLNASPEIRQQLESFSALHPKAPRHWPVDAIVLTNGDLDHTLGLLSLRESHPLGVYATERVRRGFTEGNALYRTLERFPGQVTWRTLQPGREVALAAVDGQESGLLIEAVAVPGKLPIHLERGLDAAGAGDARDNIGLKIREAATGRRLAYFPAAGGLTARAPEGARRRRLRVLRRHVLVERRAARARARHEARRGHGAPAGGRARPAAWPRSRGLSAPRRIYIHINNTNPLLRDDSMERKEAEAAGLGDRLGRDGGQRCDRGHREAAARPARSSSRGSAREGEQRYHDHHPYHALMHEGKLTPVQLQQWVLNRYYYQTRIPIKDAIILSKSEDPAFRRMWIRRIRDHDGDEGGEAGLELWLRLADGVGLDREEVASCRSVLPGVRFACDAYVELVRERSLVEAVASSLTEFFAPDLMSKRVLAWEKHYPWVSADMLAYFRSRVPRARRDSEEAIDYVVRHATTRAMQERCVAALIRKTEILWHLLDCRSPRTSSRAGGPQERAPPDGRPEPAAPGRQGASPLRPQASRYMLLYPERGLVLNATAADVLQRCDGERTVGAIVEELAQKYGHEPPAVEREVMDFLRTLADRGLVQAAV